MPDLALRADDFQPQTQIAGIAVAQHLRAACVGGQIAANRAAAFSGQAQRKQESGLLGGALQVLQNAAGLGGDRQVGGIDGAHRVHALQAQHDLLARFIGHRADG